MSSAEDPQNDRELLLVMSRNVSFLVEKFDALETLHTERFAKIESDVKGLQDTRSRLFGMISAVSLMLGFLGQKISKALGI